MNRKSIAAAAFSIAAIAAGTGVPIAAASTATHPTAENAATAFSKQDAARSHVLADAAGAFMKITGPDNIVATADTQAAFLKYTFE